MLQKLLWKKELDNNKIRAMEYNSNIMFNNMIMMTQKNEKLEREIFKLNKEISNFNGEISINKIETKQLNLQVNDLRKLDENIINKIDGIQNTINTIKIDNEEEKIKIELKNYNNKIDKALEEIKIEMKQKNQKNTE